MWWCVLCTVFGVAGSAQAECQLGSQERIHLTVLSTVCGNMIHTHCVETPSTEYCHSRVSCVVVTLMVHSIGLSLALALCSLITLAMREARASKASMSHHRVTSMS